LQQLHRREETSFDDPFPGVPASEQDKLLNQSEISKAFMVLQPMVLYQRRTKTPAQKLLYYDRLLNECGYIRTERPYVREAFPDCVIADYLTLVTIETQKEQHQSQQEEALRGGGTHSVPRASATSRIDPRVPSSAAAPQSEGRDAAMFIQVKFSLDDVDGHTLYNADPSQWLVVLDAFRFSRL